MRDHFDWKPVSWRTIQAQNHSQKKSFWLVTTRENQTQTHSHEGPTWAQNHFHEGPLDPKLLSWKNTLTSVFWKAKPKASLVRDHSDPKSPVRDKTQKHCQEGPSRPQTTLNKDRSAPLPLMKNHTDPKLLMRDHPDLNPLLLGTNLTQTHSQEITLTQSHSREITLSHNHTWETPLTQNPGTESRKWSEVWSLVVRWRCPEW